MKVLTILGTRPELIRLCVTLEKLDKYTDHVIVHTGQNYDTRLDKIFRQELGIRDPNYYLGARGSFGEQMATIFNELESIVIKEKPDAFLVLGDTNSSLGAIIAKRHGIRVFHMEAGNRCYDDRVPEEVNRRLIDHSSDILLPYTERSRQNLLAEGIAGQRIFVTGNPIYEVINHHHDAISCAWSPSYDFMLITLHRAENVDEPKRLAKFIKAFNSLAEQYEMPLVWPVHPRTRKYLDKYELNSQIELHEPMGFFEFSAHECNAACVLTDSGTVQEECAIYGVPVVTLRDSTERPETIEAGSNIVTGADSDSISRGVKLAMGSQGGIPPEYLVEDVSDTVLKIVTGYYR